MSKVFLEIAADNAAFYHEDGTFNAHEVGRILSSLADKVYADDQRRRIASLDANGNLVGTLVIEVDNER